MPFSINNFKTEISQNGILQNNKYQIYVTPCSLMSGSSITSASSDGDIAISVQDITQKMLMRATNATSPGISLVTTDINRYGYGISSKVPINSQFDSLNISFLCDKNSSIWQFWYQWLLLINNFAGIDSGTGQIFNSSGNYNLEYKDNYSTVITTVMFDNIGNISQEIDYTQAFPIGIQTIPLGWDLDNTLVKINVAITYTDYMIVGSSLN